MFIDAPYVENPAPIKPRVGYQLVLGAASAFVLLFGIWWTPMVQWTAASLQLFRG
jgi:NADH-quinone oxidoreductase subunit N